MNVRKNKSISKTASEILTGIYTLQLARIMIVLNICSGGLVKFTSKNIYKVLATIKRKSFDIPHASILMDLIQTKTIKSKVKILINKGEIPWPKIDLEDI